MLNFLKQSKLKIKGILLSGGNDINKNSLNIKLKNDLQIYLKIRKFHFLNLSWITIYKFYEKGTLKK